jgi:beta-glucosidase
VLWGWLAGQECGTGIADVLLGVTEPSGRLPWTLPARAEDVPVPNAVPRDGVLEYTEGLHVGYRSWERDAREPAACFGHGLGWTTWNYEDAGVEPADDGGVDVTVTVRNTGARAGHEVVQVYVEPPPDSDGPERPVRWLGGFAAVRVPAGASATVLVRVPRRAFEVWDADAGRWLVPPGQHVLRVGRSVRDLRLTAAAPLGQSSARRHT